MRTTSAVKALVETSLRGVVAWVQGHGYRAYEPADGNSSVLFPLTGGRVLPMRVLQQLVLRAPVNIRPLLGVSPHESAIGRGYMAWGYLLMYGRTRDARLRDEAAACLDWLVRNRARRSEVAGWGDPYDYATRGGRRPYGEPLLIWSALIGQAFLDAYELLRDERYRHVAENTGAWVLSLPRDRTATGSCLSYVAYRQSSIHNANVMGAAFLARLGALTDNREALEVAKSAMTYTCSRQRVDGSWYYAEDPKYHWIDNFHTGYNLSALKTYRRATDDGSFDDCLARGRRFYTTRFFEPDGRAKYFHDATYPVDIQCASQAIDTLSALAEDDPECLRLATTVAEWTIDNMQAKDGHFHYRDLGWKKVTTPMLHWGQATMVKALAGLLGKLDVAGEHDRPSQPRERLTTS
jgi:rhamnogalacturonyl hydrolase YesR